MRKIPLLSFSPRLLVGSLAALPPSAYAQSPVEIVKVVKNELNADSNDHTPWMYKDAYKSPDKNIVKMVIETHQGNLSEIVEDHGHPPRRRSIRTTSIGSSRSSPTRQSGRV